MAEQGFALVKDGVCVNTLVLDPDEIDVDAFGAGLGGQLIALPAERDKRLRIGDRWVDGKVVPGDPAELPPRPEAPPTLEARVDELVALVQSQQTQLDDVTQMLLEG